MKKYTQIFVPLVIAIIVIYDCYAMYAAGREASVSNLLISWGYEYPVFTFAMGFVMGHLFWRMRETSDTKLIDKGS